MERWYVYQGKGTPQAGNRQEKEKQTNRVPGIKVPTAPPWRDFTKKSRDTEKGETYQADDIEIKMVNAALYLRRPLLITGNPGTGKSSLAYSVATELDLGSVLRWNITSRTTLKDGLYSYDAIGRLQDSNLGEQSDIGKYIRLGPLGTAMLESVLDKPRVLLIDEIDKSDIDFPNDLLNIFEEGEFLIPELLRLPDEQSEISVFSGDKEAKDRVKILRGRVPCQEFPLIILTSNGEREFPPAFLRRCLRLNQSDPDAEKLAKVIKAQLSLTDEKIKEYQNLIDGFIKKQRGGKLLATDQLLNAIFLISQVQSKDPSTDLNQLVKTLNLLKPLDEPDTVPDTANEKDD